MIITISIKKKSTENKKNYLHFFFSPAKILFNNFFNIIHKFKIR